MSKVIYVDLWKSTVFDILKWMNASNERAEPGQTIELLQILRQPTQDDTPGGHVTEGWIGIVKVTTPTDAAPEVPKGQQLLDSIKKHGVESVSLPDPISPSNPKWWEDN